MLLKESSHTNNNNLMSFTLSHLTFIFFFLSCGNNTLKPGNVGIDSVFVSWNAHIKTAPDTSEKHFYQNRVEALKSFVGIKNETELNSSSIRYKFLKSISLNNLNSRACIIEEVKEGEKIRLKNYLIDLNNHVIDEYDFKKDQWVKSASNKNAIEVDGNLKKYFTDFNKGVNQDDVIASFFEDGVCTSEYYLFTTLSKDSPFAKMLYQK